MHFVKSYNKKDIALYETEQQEIKKRIMTLNLKNIDSESLLISILVNMQITQQSKFHTSRISDSV